MIEKMLTVSVVIMVIAIPCFVAYKLYQDTHVTPEKCVKVLEICERTIDPRNAHYCLAWERRCKGSVP